MGQNTYETRWDDCGSAVIEGDFKTSNYNPGFLHVGWAVQVIMDRNTSGVFLAQQIVRQFCGGDSHSVFGREVKYARRKYLVLNEKLVEDLMKNCEAGSGSCKQSEKNRLLTVDREEFCLHLLGMI